MAGEIFSMSEDLMHPRNYSAPAANNEQTEGTAKGKIIVLSEPQIYNNTSQAKGHDQPGVWGGVDYATPMAPAKEFGTKVNCSYSVDLGTGQHSGWMKGEKSDCGM
jgi:hypothetical protein